VNSRIAALALVLLFAQSGLGTELVDRRWIHGSADCDDNRDPAIEVFRFSETTYILRQNKCINFEAPFIYVLFGQRTVFVQDTGATAEPEQFALYDTIQKLVRERAAAQSGTELRMLVTHSHSHGDHTAADAQFRDKPGLMLVEPDAEAVRRYFGFTRWPAGEARIDLGGRELIVLPIPGHQAESVAIYDSQTGWLLTGDTVYPGRLYVNDWNDYRASIRKLVEFSKTHVSRPSPKRGLR
jgi:hydroxyacylglutathione hydrolase